MLYNREEIAGLDFIIDNAQKKLFNKLSDLWGIDLEAYPRCYVLEDKEGNRSIEHYEGGGEYSGNLIHSEDSKLFFTAEDDQEPVNNFQFRTKVKLYFILNLKHIYPGSKDRVDGKVLNEVVQVLKYCSGFSQLFTIVNDYQTVFESFTYEFDNIQPYFCFRIDLETTPYTLNQTC